MACQDQIIIITHVSASAEGTWSSQLQRMLPKFLENSANMRYYSFIQQNGVKQDLALRGHTN
jgi:hypothetical protein